MSSVTPIKPEPVVKTRFDKTSFVIQKKYGEKYVLIDLTEEEALRVLNDLRMYFETDNVS